MKLLLHCLKLRLGGYPLTGWRCESCIGKSWSGRSWGLRKSLRLSRRQMPTMKASQTLVGTFDYSVQNITCCVCVIQDSLIKRHALPFLSACCCPPALISGAVESWWHSSSQPSIQDLSASACVILALSMACGCGAGVLQG